MNKKEWKKRREWFEKHPVLYLLTVPLKCYCYPPLPPLRDEGDGDDAGVSKKR